MPTDAEHTEPAALTALREYAKCTRGDWSDFDGRSNLAAIEDLANAIQGIGTRADWSVQQWRTEHGICPTDGDHWTKHCGWMGCETKETPVSNEKPVELTKAERAALMHHIGGWKFERQGLANAEDAFMAEVSRIVAAREAAARREALLEAAEDLFTLCERRDKDPLMHDRETAGIKIAGHRLRALTEPERDEKYDAPEEG